MPPCQIFEDSVKKETLLDTSSKSKIPYLDAFRGMAILLVIFHHISSDYGNGRMHVNYFVLKLHEFGNMGVQLFFLISAITLFRALEYRNDQPRNIWFNFAVRRVFRIAPLYFCGIIYFTWQYGGIHLRSWGDEFFEITFKNVFYNFIFVHGFDPYSINSIVPGGWSIAAEMLFYISLPFLFMKIKNTNQAVFALCLSLVFKMILFFFLTRFPLINEKTLWTSYLYFYFPNALPVFITGIIAYFVIFKEDSKVLMSNLVLVSMIALVLCFMRSESDFYLLFTALFFCLIVLVGQRRKISNVSILGYIGKISYSAYFIHFAVIYWMYRMGIYKAIHFENPTITMLSIYFIVLLFTLLFSVMTYLVIEKPFIKFGSFLLGKWTYTSQKKD